MPSRCDLHVHTKRSDRPSEWYLERIGAPESFTEPLDLYRIARARGMDFVTVTDRGFWPFTTVQFGAIPPSVTVLAPIGTPVTVSVSLTLIGTGVWPSTVIV